jgi:hypothetical protein
MMLPRPSSADCMGRHLMRVSTSKLDFRADRQFNEHFMLITSASCSSSFASPLQEPQIINWLVGFSFFNSFCFYTKALVIYIPCPIPAHQTFRILHLTSLVTFGPMAFCAIFCAICSIKLARKLFRKHNMKQT